MSDLRPGRNQHRTRGDLAALSGKFRRFFGRFFSLPTCSLDRRPSTDARSRNAALCGGEFPTEKERFGVVGFFVDVRVQVALGLVAGALALAWDWRKAATLLEGLAKLPNGGRWKN
eukprot:scaffold3474_cov246-Pinguiococcus_pyrenoidosus.AAC.18